jgi:hypothetical protein
MDNLSSAARQRNYDAIVAMLAACGAPADSEAGAAAPPLDCGVEVILEFVAARAAAATEEGVLVALAQVSRALPLPFPCLPPCLRACVCVE